MHHPRKRPEVVESLSGNECFLYDGEGEALTVLNASALFIWSLCDGHHRREDILRVMQRIYPDVPADLLDRDISRTLADFQTRGLLAEDPQPPPATTDSITSSEASSGPGTMRK